MSSEFHVTHMEPYEVLAALAYQLDPTSVVTNDAGMCANCAGYTGSGMYLLCKACVPVVLRQLADRVESAKNG